MNTQKVPGSDQFILNKEQMAHLWEVVTDLEKIGIRLKEKLSKEDFQVFFFFFLADVPEGLEEYFQVVSIMYNRNRRVLLEVAEQVPDQECAAKPSKSQRRRQRYKKIGLMLDAANQPSTYSP